MTEKRRCTATTKAGKPCRGNPVYGTDLCLAHSPAKVRESVGFVADNGFQGRPRRPRVIDRLIERIDSQLDEILDVYFEGLRAERAVVVGNGPSAFTEMVPDYTERRHSADAILDRGHGKPRQVTEVTGAEGGPVQIARSLENPETRKVLLDLVGRLGAARAASVGTDQPRRLGPGD